jgi:hypothetical protein
VQTNPRHGHNFEHNCLLHGSAPNMVADPVPVLHAEKVGIVSSLISSIPFVMVNSDN